MSELLSVESLTTSLRNGVRIVDDISFSIKASETFALLGESGCGKSMTALSLLRLLPDGVVHAGGTARLDGVDECLVIGGAEIYALALPRCDRLYLTEVHATVEGDAFFPAFNHAQWREARRERFVASAANPYDYSFVVYEKA